MRKEFISGRVIAQPDDWPETPAEFDDCTVRNLDLSGTSLADCVFTDCTFTDCNLSNANLRNTAFRNVEFSRCKLLGMLFEDCNPFLLGVEFESCNLLMASFRAMKLAGTVFNDCSLREADFSEASLYEAVFNNCDLLNAVFDYTSLEDADLSTSRNYRINPENNMLSGARFSYPEVAGLLADYGVVLV